MNLKLIISMMENEVLKAIMLIINFKFTSESVSSKDLKCRKL